MEFAPQEAEGIVKQIRTGLRAVQEKENAGDASGAARLREKTYETLELFRRRLLEYWGRQVRKQIPFAAPVELEDAIEELHLRVLKAVMDTTPSPSAAHWERRFHQCSQRRAIDICRPLQKRYGYGTQTEQEGAVLTFSASAQNNRVPVSETAFLERLPDRSTEKEIESLLGNDFLQQVVNELGGRDRNNLRLWWRWDGGETWETIAASEDLLPDTVRKRVQATLKVMRRIAVGKEN